MNQINSTTLSLLVIIAVFCGVVLLVQLIRFFLDFSQELKRLNNEIRRTHGEERKRWRRRRRRLWLSLIPFVRY